MVYCGSAPARYPGTQAHKARKESDLSSSLAFCLASACSSGNLHFVS